MILTVLMDSILIVYSITYLLLPLPFLDIVSSIFLVLFCLFTLISFNLGDYRLLVPVANLIIYFKFITVPFFKLRTVLCPPNWLVLKDIASSQQPTSIAYNNPKTPD